MTTRTFTSVITAPIAMIGALWGIDTDDDPMALQIARAVVFVLAAVVALPVTLCALVIIVASGGLRFDVVRGDYCSECRDVHPVGEGRCVVTGMCPECDRRRRLDRFGACANCGASAAVITAREMPHLRIRDTEQRNWPAGDDGDDRRGRRTR